MSVVRGLLSLLVISLSQAVVLKRPRLRGANTSTSWAVCSFDWEAPGTIEQKDPRKLYINYLPGLTDESWDEFRNKCRPDIEHQPSGLTLKKHVQVLMGMTREVSDILTHEIGVPWYIGYGGLVGQLRFASALPWDDDIDILVPREDRLQILEHYTDTRRYPCFVDREKTRITWDDARSLAVVTVLSDTEDTLDKALWWDVASNTVIDGCFDSQYEWDRLLTEEGVDDVMAGDIPIRVPHADTIWAQWPGLMTVTGIDYNYQAVRMPTSKGFGSDDNLFKCVRFTCDGAPNVDPSATAAQSFREYLAEDSENVFRDIMFQIDGERAHCSLPVLLDGCQKESTIPDEYAVSTCV